MSDLDQAVTALRSGKFQTFSRGVESFGYTQDTLWLHLPLWNPGINAVPLLATLAVSRLNRVEWFVLSGEGHLLHAAQSGLEAKPRQSLHGRYPRMMFTAPAGQRIELFIRIRSDSSIYAPLRLHPLAKGFENFQAREFWDFAFVGFGFSLSFVCFLFAWFVRRRSFAVLGVSLFFFLVYHLIFHGYVHWLFPAAPLWIHRNFLLFIAGAAFLTMLHFTRLYVPVSELRASDCAAMTWTARITLTVMLLLTVVPFHHAHLLIFLCNILTYLLGFWVALRLYLKSREVHDLSFLLAWITVNLTLLLFAFQIYNLLPILLMPVEVTRFLIPLNFLFFLSALVRQGHIFQTQREETLLAQRATERARLDALRYQLNPHFLFNCLNSIEALSRNHPAKIPEIVRKLAVFLRLRLMPSADGLNRVSDEIDTLRAYLDIENVRFQDQLQISIEVQEGCESMLIPELILQPLVENAVKYGRRSREPLHIDIKIYPYRGALILLVKNSGSLGGKHHHNLGEFGIGTQNLKQRLEYLYGRRAHFHLSESEDGTVTATLSLPLAS